MLVEYDGNPVHIFEIVELQDGKIKSARAYFGEPFEAALQPTPYSPNSVEENSPQFRKLAHLGDVPAAPGRVW